MKNKKTGIWLWILINTVLLLAVMELGLRAANLKFKFLPLGTPAWVKFSPTVHYEIQPHFSGEIYYTPAQINSYGLRGPEFNLDKGDTLRIICLGNSCTFGNGVFYQETFCHLLDRKLRSKLQGKAQVIDAGIPGYSSYQGLKYLQEKILTLKPDWLIVSFGFNDRRGVVDASWKDSEEFFQRDYQKYQKINFLRQSYIFRLCELLIPEEKRLPKIIGYEVRVDTVQFRKNLEKIAEIAIINNISLIFLGIPDNPRLINPYYTSQEFMDKDNVYQARFTVEKMAGIYSRLARWRFNQRVKTEGLKIDTLSLTDDVMTFNGGLPLFTADEYNEIMKEVANRYDFHYLDLESILNDSDYVDFIHLNNKGAEKVAEKLEEMILKIK
jgi:lysophospholipase L1-like esterase